LTILISDIVNGLIPAGEALPRETDLAAQFEISRGTVREVIRGLEERSLISVKHGRGATVNPSEQWDTLDPDVLGALLSGPSSTKTLRDFLEARRVLEIEAAGMAAERADDDDIARLTQAMEGMREAADRAERNPSAERQYHEADLAFHRALIQATKNSTLVGLTGKIHAATLQARFPTARPMLRGTRTLPEHERIMQAVASGKATAARKAMKDHLDSVEEFLGEYSAEHSDGVESGGGGSRSRRRNTQAVHPA
jgi:GntR family transcriptional repressor for pyruvate dehydrogenase complex